jgi:uncharacterized protein involved in exopolysaccharide biosynthesis
VIAAAGYDLGTALWFIIVIVVPIAAIISAATTPSSTFRAANSNKVLWVLLPILFGFIAACLYFFWIRPRLLRATR